MLFGHYNRKAYSAGVAVDAVAVLVGLKAWESDLDLLALVVELLREEGIEELFKEASGEVVASEDVFMPEAPENGVPEEVATDEYWTGNIEAEQTRAGVGPGSKRPVDRGTVEDRPVEDGPGDVEPRGGGIIKGIGDGPEDGRWELLNIYVRVFRYD